MNRISVITLSSVLITVFISDPAVSASFAAFCKLTIIPASTPAAMSSTFFTASFISELDWLGGCPPSPTTKFLTSPKFMPKTSRPRACE